MSRFVDLVETGLRVVAALCLVILTCLVVFQVGMRYVVGGVPFFAEEFARYAMIWMTLIAVAVGVREASHIRIDFVPTALAHFLPGVHRWLEAALDVISLTIFLVLVWYGIDMVIFAAGQTSGGVQVPLSYPYAAVPVAFVFATIFAALRLASGRSGT